MGAGPWSVTPDGPRDPVCPTCSKPLASGSLVLYQHGAFFHVRCVSQALGLAAAEASDDVGEAKSRAVETMARSARLLEKARRIREDHARSERPAKERSG
jgi:hypothetical protein